MSSPCGLQLDEVTIESADGGEPSFTVAAATITTAAALAHSTTDSSAAACRGYIARPSRPGEHASPLERVSPDAFQQGMTVLHPEYGPGKIVALSGAGKNRRATIQFATVGQKKIILAHSPIRQAR